MILHTTLSQIDQFEAAKTGNLQWFKQQHAVGALPDLAVADLDYQYVIEYAARNGHLNVVKYLIEECDQDVDVTTHENMAVRYAAQHGHLAVVKYLIEDSGQDIDATTDGNYAIRYAAKNGHLDVVKYLIEDSGQDVDVAALDNYALRYAAMNGHLDVVKYLIEDSGQDVSATIRNNYTLRYAAANGHLNIVKYLIEECPQYIDLPALGQKLLQAAVDQERSELITYLTPICEAAEVIGSVIYAKIRPILLNSGTSGNVDTIVDVNNNNLSNNLPSRTSDLSEASRSSFTDMLQYLSAVPAEILQTLVTSAEGLQQLHVYLQKASSDSVCTLATTNQVPRL